MPLYNSEFTVRESIESVLAQTFRDFELIVVDDASVDDGPQIVASCCDTDKRIRLLRCSKNGGAGVARNVGLSNALGRYIAFLDADDKWLPKKLDIQLNQMIERNIAFSCSWYRIEDLNGNCMGVRRAASVIKYKDLLIENVIGCLTVIFDRQKLSDRRMPSIRKRQDFALWLEILKDVNCYCVQEELAVYRVVPGSVSQNKLEMVKCNYRMFRDCEKLSVISSFYFVIRNVIRRLHRSLDDA
jgi:teichuronic acid biosynthesis glycosyltransferase TuaG